MSATAMNAASTARMPAGTSARNPPRIKQQQAVSFPKNLFSAAESASCLPVNDAIQCRSSLHSASYAILQSRNPSTKATDNTFCVRTLDNDATYSYTIYVLNVPQYKGQRPTMIKSQTAYKQAMVRRLKPNRKEYGVFIAGERVDCIKQGGNSHFVPKYFIQAVKGKGLFARFKNRKVDASASREERHIYLANGGDVGPKRGEMNEKIATVATTRAASSKSHATTTISKASFRDMQEQRFWITVCAVCDEMDKDNLIDSV